MKNDNFESFVNMCAFSKMPYKVILTNYTQRLESDFLVSKELKEEKSIKFFIAGNKVKIDVKKKEKPTTEKHKSKFFDFNIKDNFFCDEIYGIDITNCYASVLLNEGYISKETFNYLLGLKKLDRLGAIGMLASNKKIFSFDENNNIIDIEEITADTENYFYFAVQKTEEIMRGARELIENKSEYLFTWVDCIYFREQSNIQILLDYFKSINIQCKTKHYTQFLVKRQMKNFKLTFFEDEEIKQFYIPLPQAKIKEQLEQFLINKQKQNESI